MSEEAMEWAKDRRCVICGKEFSVLYPEEYVYKRWARHRLLYFCSYGCMRKHDKAENGSKERAVGNRSQIETGRQMLEAMEAGQDPVEWLAKQGYRFPEKAYSNIRKACQLKRPELGDRFPDHLTRYRAQKAKEAARNDG